MDYKLHKLSNGLRVLTVPMPNLESATVTIWVRVGSRYETPKINGLSHFLEHMVFKGSKKRPTAMQIAEAVDAFGGEFNASTSKEWTNFYIKARSANLEIAFDVLSDMVLNPLLKAEEMEKEKGVITEEIGMIEDTPMHKVWDLFEQAMYAGNPLGQDIIGTPKTVRGLKQADFSRYRNTHYFAENLLLTVSGGINEKKVLQLAESHLGMVKKAKPLVFKRFVGKQKRPQMVFDSKKKEQAHFVLGFGTNPKGHKERFVEAVVTAILGGGMSSRLFTEIREKRGLAYAVKSTTEHYADTGYLATYAGVEVKRADEALKVALDQHYGLASGELGITDKELANAKEYVKGHLALSLEDTKMVNYFFGEDELILGRVQTPEEVFAGINAVTREDCLRLAKKFFVPERLNVALIGPYKNAAKFEKLLRA